MPAEPISRGNSTKKARKSWIDQSDSSDAEPFDDEEIAAGLIDGMLMFPQFVKMATRGRKVVKYSRRGKPQKKILKVDFAKGVVSWDGADAKITKIETVHAGKTTAIFQGLTEEKVKADQCFSLITEERSLDFRVSSKAVRDLWVAGLLDLIKQKQDPKKLTTQLPAVQVAADWATLAEQGVYFLKHVGRGKPQRRLVKVGGPEGLLEVGSSKFSLTNVKAIMAGKNSKVLSKVKHSEADPRHCFSIIVSVNEKQKKEKVVDLQASSEDERDVWVEGLQRLLMAADVEEFEPPSKVRRPTSTLEPQLQTVRLLESVGNVVMAIMEEIAATDGPYQAEDQDSDFEEKGPPKSKGHDDDHEDSRSRNEREDSRSRSANSRNDSRNEDPLHSLSRHTRMDKLEQTNHQIIRKEMVQQLTTLAALREEVNKLLRDNAALKERLLRT